MENNESFAALQEEIRQIKNESKTREEVLNNINGIMWNTWAVKGRDFGHNEGRQIMEELNKWASIDA